MAWKNINGKRTWVKDVDPEVYDDPQFAVTVLYDENGIGHLDHRAAAAAWDDQARDEREKVA